MRIDGWILFGVSWAIVLFLTVFTLIRTLMND